MSPGAGAEIDDLIGSQDHLRIMFDHDDRVLPLPQLLERLQETEGVSCMEADARLIEDIKRFSESRAQCPCKGNPLIFSAREGPGLPGEGQVSQSDIDHESDPVRDLFKKALGHSLLKIFDRQVLKEILEVGDAHFAKLGNILLGDADIEGLFFESGVVADQGRGYRPGIC